MTENELKSEVIKKLAADYGIWFKGRAYYKRLCAAVETETHIKRGLNQPPFGYLTRFVEGALPEPEPRGFPFRPLTTHTHPRIAEIRTQPELITPHGVGNQPSFTMGWGR